MARTPTQLDQAGQDTLTRAMQAASQWRRAQEDLETARTDLAHAIQDALAAGVPKRRLAQDLQLARTTIDQWIASATPHTKQ